MTNVDNIEEAAEQPNEAVNIQAVRSAHKDYPDEIASSPEGPETASTSDDRVNFNSYKFHTIYIKIKIY